MLLKLALDSVTAPKIMKWNAEINKVEGWGGGFVVLEEMTTDVSACDVAVFRSFKSCIQAQASATLARSVIPTTGEREFGEARGKC